MSRRVFISSASGALAPYRSAAIDVCHRLGLIPVAMEEFDPQRPSPIEACRDLVASTDVFVLLLAHRYGSRPSGDSPSFTELEYGWALTNSGMPLLPFVVDPAHPWPPPDIDSGVDAAALAALKARVSSSHVVKTFTTVESFRMDLLIALQPHKQPEPAGRADVPLPVPPALHAVPPYVGSAPFTGRHADLSTLDEWARSKDPIMVVEAIGGTGKSALTWEWMTERANETIAGLAGYVWWSFYDGSPSMARFMQEVFAYIGRHDPETVRGIPPTQLREYLLLALRSRPYLLVLDGFERLLHAYHRFDPTKIRDEEVEPKLRSMIEPRAEDTLLQLAAASPSKILISSRLMPITLQGRMGPRLPGVRHVRLPGLTDDDTAELLARLGTRGNRSTISGFFTPLGNHPLLVGVVAGLVRDYRPDPGNLDAWLTDSKAGGHLGPAALDLVQRRKHILAAAFDGLPAPSHRLLGWISVLSGTVDWATLKAINPFRTGPAVPDDPAAAQLDHALTDLEERGLLWWNRQANSYDMHPIIRAYAHDRLDVNDRVQANTAVRDYFTAKPAESLVDVKSVEDLHQTIAIFRALIGAGLLDEADRMWRQDLSETLLQQLGAYSAVVELLGPLAESASPDTRGDLTVAHLLQGRYEEAIGQEERLLTDLLIGKTPAEAVLSSISRLSTAYRFSGRLLEVSGLLALYAEVCEAAGGDPARDRDLAMHSAALRLLSGKLDAARHLIDRAGRLAPKTPPRWFDGSADLYWLELSFRTNDVLTPEMLAIREEQAASASQRMRLAHLRLRVLVRRGMLDAALEAAEHHQRLAYNAGFDTTPAMIAYLLARTGRREAAVAVEETINRLPGLHPADRPHLLLAQALHHLGRHSKAKEHAFMAYRQAWGTGPPLYHYWDLREATDMLTQLDEKPPHLPITSVAAVAIPITAAFDDYLARLKKR